MTVDNNITNLTAGLNTTQTSGTHQANPAESARAHHGHDRLAGDHVDISSVTTQLAAQAASSDPAKLARLQAEYDSGAYNVSPSQIANSIIADAAAQ